MLFCPVLARAAGLRPATGFGWPTTTPLDRTYHHTVWTTEQGLPQNAINAIVQTRDGYLWPDTAILIHNGYRVAGSASYSGRFKKLSKQRFDLEHPLLSAETPLDQPQRWRPY